MRVISDAEYCHERLGEQFGEALSDYDTTRRVEVLIDDFLGPYADSSSTALDVGCGLGFFSEALHQRGVDVTACDLGEQLVAQTRTRVGCRAQVADALDLVDQFGSNCFDIVTSSECIEHTPDPARAVAQMAGVLKAGGWLSISTPNVVWQPIVRAATQLKLRPFDGFENFSSWYGLRHTLDACGIDVVREQGLHLIPFQLKWHTASRWMDRHLQGLRGCMINICILGRKRGSQQGESSSDWIKEQSDLEGRVA